MLYHPSRPSREFRFPTSFDESLIIFKFLGERNSGAAFDFNCFSGRFGLLARIFVTCVIIISLADKGDAFRLGGRRR